MAELLIFILFTLPVLAFLRREIKAFRFTLHACPEEELAVERARTYLESL